jgi:hypothetical protein
MRAPINDEIEAVSNFEKIHQKQSLRIEFRFSPTPGALLAEKQRGEGKRLVHLISKYTKKSEQTCTFPIHC